MSAFFVLSGYVTHLSSAALDLSSCRAYTLWMLRRCAVLLVTTYASIAFALVLHLQCDCGPFLVWQFVRCMLMIEELSLIALPEQPNDFCRGAYGYCPNFLAWTVSAFILLWLLYPPIGMLIRASERQCGAVWGVVAPVGVIWAAMLKIIIGLTVAHADGGVRWLSSRTHEITYYTGIFWLGDFLVGIAVASVVLANAKSAGAGKLAEGNPLLPTPGASTRPGGTSWKDSLSMERMGCSLHGAVADVCIVIVGIVVCAVPSNMAIPAPLWASHTSVLARVNVATTCLLCWQTWSHAFAPLIGLYLLASRDGSGLTSRILGHPVFVYLGGLSMSVYLFHRMWATAVVFALGYRDDVLAHSQLNKPAALSQPLVALAYLVSLLFFCTAWHYVVELPIGVRIRNSCTSGRTEKDRRSADVEAEPKGRPQGEGRTP